MKFCKQCGAECKNYKNFCPSCGAKIQEKRDIHSNSEKGVQKPKKPMLKKKKVLLISMLILAIALFGVHQYIASTYTPQRVVDDFITAVKKQNVEEAERVIDFSKFDKKFSEKEVKIYLAFLQEKQTELLEQLMDYSSNDKYGQEFENVVIDENGNEIVKMIKGDKKFGLYQEYKIEAIPFELEVYTHLEDVKVELLDAKKKLDEENILTKILPGSFELKGVYEGEYSNLTDTFELDFMKAYNNSLAVELEFEEEYIKLSSNEENATLFVNGKSTGETIGSFYNHFGPIATDGSIVLSAEYKIEDKVIKSNEVTVMNDNDVYLEFEEEDIAVTANDLEFFIEQYIQTSILAMNTGDFSIVESYHDPNGKSYNESKDYIDYIVSKGITEDVISLEMTDYEEVENGFLVKTKEAYDIHYADGSTKRKTFKSTYRVVQNDSRELKLWALESTDEI